MAQMKSVQMKVAHTEQIVREKVLFLKKETSWAEIVKTGEIKAMSKGTKAHNFIYPDW